MNINLNNKVALVTGGSRGIGRAIALQLAECGADVALTYAHSTEAAEDVRRQVEEYGVKSLSLQSDAAQTDKANETIQKVVSDFGQLDILVNNAGINRDNLILRMSEKEWDEVLDTNLKSIFNYCKAAAKPMLRSGGSIINISSVVGLSGNAGQSNYAASKAGIVGFTKSYAKELASRDIRANIIAPGYITTEMTDELPEDVMQSIQEQTPLERAGRVEEISAVAAFLASNLSSYITGETIRVDEGMAM